MTDSKPTAILYGEINTNVFGVLGRAADGTVHPIRAFSGLKFRADEGISLYSLSSARDEAKEIAERNNLRYGTAAPSDYRRLLAILTKEAAS